VNPIATPLRIRNDFPNLYPANAGTVTTTVTGDLITFTPAAGFTGQVYFDYKITDNGPYDGYASVSVGVGVAASATINRPPTAIADTISVAENTSVTGNVGANNGAGPDYDVDGDPLTFQLVGAGPQHGVLTAGLASNGSFTYTPAHNFHGVDTFDYQ